LNTILNEPKMDWNAGDFCVVKLSSQTVSYSNAKILEVFPSRRKALVTDITYGDIGEVSIEDLKPFQEFGASKEGFLEHKSIRSEAFGRPAGWMEGDICTARWEEDGRWYRARILKIFDINEILVYFVDYGNADFTCLGDILSHDLSLVCGEKEWKVSSVLLSRRSPFFKAAISNNLEEKLEMKFEINDLDPEAMQEVLNYMHSVKIKAEEALFPSLLEASERFQMEDMKEDVVEIGRKYITEENAVEIGKLAELYDIDSLLEKCIEFIAENGIKIEEDNVAPKLTVGVLRLREDELKWMKISRRRVIEDRNDIQLDNQELKDELHCMEDDLWDSTKKKKRLKMEKHQLIMENHRLFRRLKKVEVERDNLRKELLDFKVKMCKVVQKWDAPKESDAASTSPGEEDESDNSDIEPPKAKRRKTTNRHKSYSSSESHYSTDQCQGDTPIHEQFSDFENEEAVESEHDSTDDGDYSGDKFSDRSSEDICFSPEDWSDAESDCPVFSEDEEEVGGPVFSEDEVDEGDPVFSEDVDNKEEYNDILNYENSDWIQFTPE